MNVGKEFTNFETEMNWRDRKRIQLVDTDDRRTIFAERMEEFRI
jgi:hypothetical protein